MINRTKAGEKQAMYYKYVLPKKSIEEVQKDVLKWGLERDAEIDSMRNNENFRKEFLQNISHELKTPIFAIQGYLEILQDMSCDENNEMHQKYLNNIHRNMERLSHLLKDVDEISAIEHGRYQLNYTNFSVQQLIKEVFEITQLETQQKNIKCSIKKGCESPAINISADKEKIQQVLINLVINATKYGKENGEIIASIYNTDGTHALIEITDTGMGISEEHLPRIFERFYRADKSRERKIGGSGLGLAICKHFIEAHEGSIHIRSKIGVGTTVGFLLPINQKVATKK